MTFLGFMFCSGVDNQAVTWGPHSEAFAHRLGKSHFVGLRVNPGQVWAAKGRYNLSVKEFLFTHSFCHRFHHAKCFEACRAYSRAVSPGRPRS